jgi:hypothetical protein
MESLKLKALDIVGEHKDPIKSLWRNVLIVALEDAIGKGFRCYGMSDRNYYNSARAYFTEPNADFKAVCTFAGFDHEYIRMKAKQYFRKEQDGRAKR